MSDNLAKAKKKRPIGQILFQTHVILFKQKSTAEVLHNKQQMEGLTSICSILLHSSMLPNQDSNPDRQNQNL